MPSSVLLAITFLVVVCSAKHRYDRSTRESLTEWRTTECTMLNGEQTEPCPSPGANGDWPCIRYSDLCNGLRDCPNGEDESPVHCHFHHLDHDKSLSRAPNYWEWCYVSSVWVQLAKSGLSFLGRWQAGIIGSAGDLLHIIRLTTDCSEGRKILSGNEVAVKTVNSQLPPQTEKIDLEMTETTAISGYWVNRDITKRRQFG
ncbi:unnamed protein product [Haemonchus placei]|uniref:Hemoglobin linker chain n=1 Tax=Haemonchus placei TaxID=6290 RepID=A0A0N4WSF7_HAEPC|nr:unnamed protein product [Haemonchus placei]